MRKQALIDYFGSPKAAADAFGIKVQAFYQWNDDKIPEGRAYQAHVLSGGQIPLCDEVEQDARAEVG